jgi:hypothetical protein
VYGADVTHGWVSGASRAGCWKRNRTTSAGVVVDQHDTRITAAWVTGFLRDR